MFGFPFRKRLNTDDRHTVRFSPAPLPPPEIAYPTFRVVTNTRTTPGTGRSRFLLFTVVVARGGERMLR